MIVSVPNRPRISDYSYQSLQQTLDEFSPIYLSEMMDVPPLNRVFVSYELKSANAIMINGGVSTSIHLMTRQ